MEAGRELDKLVAEHVMGWREVRQDYYYGLAWYGKAPKPQKGDSPQDKAKGISHLPAYSTDLAAMWQVIEAMRESGWWYTLTDVQWDDRHQAEFRRVGERGVHQFQYALAETAQVAICLAALKALGVELKTVAQTF